MAKGRRFDDDDVVASAFSQQVRPLCNRVRSGKCETWLGETVKKYDEQTATELVRG